MNILDFKQKKSSSQKIDNTKDIERIIVAALDHCKENSLGDLEHDLEYFTKELSKMNVGDKATLHFRYDEPDTSYNGGFLAELCVHKLIYNPVMSSTFAMLTMSDAITIFFHEILTYEVANISIRMELPDGITSNMALDVGYTGLARIHLERLT